MFAYRLYIDRKDTLPNILAPALQARMLSLYVQGRTCEEIAKIMPAHAFGQIVYCRVHGSWDRLMAEQLDRLLYDTVRRTQRVQLDTIQTMLDLISAHNQINKEAVERYFATGEKEIFSEEAGISASYKAAMELMLKLTGQDQKRPIVGDTGGPSSDFRPDDIRPPTANEQKSYLDALAKDK